MAPNKRCHYSAAFKRKVVLAAELSSNVQAGRDFGVDEKNVRRWRTQRERIFACAATRLAITGPRECRHHEMEMALADFVQTQRAAALPVTTEVLQAKARELLRERGLSRAHFKASRGWLQKFMKHFGFSLRRRTSIAQKLPGDFEEKLIEFQHRIFMFNKRVFFL